MSLQFKLRPPNLFFKLQSIRVNCSIKGTFEIDSYIKIDMSEGINCFVNHDKNILSLYLKKTYLPIHTPLRFLDFYKCRHQNSEGKCLLTLYSESLSTGNQHESAMSWNSGLQSLLPIAITWGIIKNSDAWLPPARYFDLIGMGTTWASGFLKKLSRWF